MTVNLSVRVLRVRINNYSQVHSYYLKVTRCLTVYYKKYLSKRRCWGEWRGSIQGFSGEGYTLALSWALAVWDKDSYETEEDLDAALDHLASFGVIHYYPHLLPNAVFVDPQVILNKISELVKYHYKLRHETDSSKLRYKVDPNILRKFRNEGCISLKLLEQFPAQYTKYFTPADFLKLLNIRLIVTHLISGDEYFMTCLLRTMEPHELDQYRATLSSESGVAPLAIHFSCKLVPHGVFCSLVAFLRSQSSSWNLSLCPEDNTKPLCLTRNCIKFQLPEDDPGSLTLIDAFSHFEVHVEASHDICVRLCPSIWQTLDEGIQKAAETLKYSELVPKLAFICKQHKNTRPHLALPNKAFDHLKCELNQDTSGKLTDEHKVWKGNNNYYFYYT